MMTTLIVPGLNGSGPGHWQRWLHDRVPGSGWVAQQHWDQPDLAVWSAQLLKDIDAARGRIILVAHSFGCLVSVAAAVQRPDRIAGALLVAPADPRKFGVSRVLPRQHLGFPSLVVASSNDPWVSLATARYWAGRWASRFINLGPHGHINIESGFGPWPKAQVLHDELVAASQGLGRPASWLMRGAAGREAPPSAAWMTPARFMRDASASTLGW